MKHILSTFFIIVLTSLSAVADEPTSGTIHAINNTGWDWMLTSSPMQQLELSNSKGSRAIYDISECSFCTGEEDNCHEDGIYVVNLPDKEPAIAVVCHKGAHSQRLQILAPLRDNQNPIFTVTGDYWVDYQPIPQGFKVTYDRRGSDGMPIINTTKWPRQVDHE